MRLHVGRPRAAMIVAPHPDDEVIGAAGLIRILAARGVRVHVTVVSDGAGSHRGSVRWPRRRLVAARRRESRLALGRLGICAGRLRFLGMPDGALTGHARSTRCLHAALARVRGLDLIVGPAPDDAHPDHRAVAAAMAAWRAPPRRIAYRVWPPQRLGGCRTRTIVGLRGHAGKRALIRLHRTQTGAITDDATGFAIARHELDHFAHPIERFREVRS